MISFERLWYSLRNLYARKTRSFLTILSIFAGIATIFIFVSFGIGLVNYVDELAGEVGADKVLVQASGFSFTGDGSFRLEESDLRVVQQTRGILEAGGAYYRPVTVESGGEREFANAFAYSDDISESSVIQEFFSLGISQGRDLVRGDRKRVVLGYNYGVDGIIFTRGIMPGQRISINGERFRVVGVLDSYGNPDDDGSVYMYDEDLKSLFPNESLGYAMIIARVDNPSTMDEIVDRVTRELRRHRDLDEGKEDFFVTSFEDYIATFSVVLNMIVGFVVLIALVSVVVSAVNTTNTMVTSVLERTREIGIMKAIGATNGEIRNIFLIESGILGLFGGILGVLVGWALSEYGGYLLNELGWGFLSPGYHWLLFAGCVLFATLVGVISGVFPAHQASKLNPVDALRYE